ncbi:AMIN domain-containing protein [Planktothrix agardhii 1033]|nr:AMIN domain-containing protein [Planktothrix agardhii 1033]
MQAQNFKQKFKQTVQTCVASDVTALYGSMLLRTSSIFTCLALATAYPLTTQAASVVDWKIDPNTGIVEVELPPGNQPQLSVYNLPPRLILDLPNTEVKVNITERYETGVVSQVSLIQTKPQQAQLVVEFTPGITIDSVATAQPQTTPTPSPTRTATATQTTATVKPTAPQKPPQYSVRQYDPRQTVLPNPQPTRDSSLDVVRVPVSQPRQAQLFPTVPPPPQTTAYRPPIQVSQGFAAAPNPQYSGTASLPQAVPFGQPLPPGQQQSYLNPRAPTILLPTGTDLTLLYPTEDQVRLTRRSERQDVLLLQGGIVDSLGNYIVPPDTPIVGEFETTTKGSRFIAQAINLDGRSIPIQGQSNWIPGSLEVRPERVGIGTGAGSLAGFLISGFTGVGALVGAIAGAGIGIGTSPSPTTLQPGQIISIQLTQDLTTPNFFLVNQ